MNKTVADQLLDIMTAVRELPGEAQEILVHEIADHVSEYAHPRLDDDQRAEVEHRLANPAPGYATPENVRTFFACFGIRPA